MTNWKTGLRKYQVTGAQWLSEKPTKFARGRLLADPMGFGKTRSALGAARLVLEQGPLDTNTVVVTTALSRADWAREAHAYWPEVPVHVVSLDEVKYRKKNESDTEYAERKVLPMLQAIRSGAPPALVVTSYESSTKLLALAQERDCLLGRVIVDEAHACKKVNSAYSRIVRQLASRAEQTLLLTGTPIHNRCEEVHTLVDLIAPGALGSKYHFANKYFDIVRDARGYGSTIGTLLPEMKDKLAEDLKPFILCRSVKDAFGELPARIRKVVKVECPNAMLITREKVRALRDRGLDEALRKACGAKLKVGADLIADLDGPVVVYVQERKHARELGKMLERKHVTYLLAMGGPSSEGGTTAEKRAALIETWKAGAAQVLICTMDAVKESATLTHAAQMVFLDIDWLPGKQLQCEGRIDPSRQPEAERRPVCYYYVVLAGGVDEAVAARVIEKISQADGVIGKAGEGEMTKLKDAFRGLVKAPAVDTETEAEAMADLIDRLNARAERLDSIGLSGYEDANG